MTMEGLAKACMRDLGEIMGLEAKCFGEHGYPARLVLALMTMYPELFLVYRAGGRVAGYAAGIVRRGIICHLMSLCVDPSMRGRGIGRLLLRELERRFSAHGCLVSRLEVDFHNMPALRLYSGAGYRPALYRPDYYSGGRPALVMYRALRGENHPSSRDKL